MSQPVQLQKGSDESRIYTFDFSAQPEIAGGETLSGPTVTATPSTTPTLTIGAPAVAGKTITVRLAAGLNGQRYLVKCDVNTSGSDILTGWGALLVQDPG